MRGEVHLAGADRPVHLPWLPPHLRGRPCCWRRSSSAQTIRDGGSVRERFEFVAERAGVSIAITSITNFLGVRARVANGHTRGELVLPDAAGHDPVRLRHRRELLPRRAGAPRGGGPERGRPKRAFDAAAAETRPLPPSRTEAARGRRDVERRLAETTTMKTTSENASNASSGVFDRVVRGYAEFLMRTSVRVAVLLVFAGYGAAGLANVGSVEEGLPRTALAPDDSFLQGYFSKFDARSSRKPASRSSTTSRGSGTRPPRRRRASSPPGACFWDRRTSRRSPPTRARTARVRRATGSTPPPPPANVHGALRGAARRRRGVRAGGRAFRGLEVTGPGGPDLIPEMFFMDALNAAVAARPEIAAVLRRPPDASSISGCGAPVASVVVTRTRPVADDYPMQLRIYEDMIRCDEEIRWMFEAESNGAHRGGRREDGRRPSNAPTIPSTIRRSYYASDRRVRRLRPPPRVYLFREPRVLATGRGAVERAGGELVTRGHRRVHRVRFGVSAPRGFGGGGGGRRRGRVPLRHAS